MMETPQGRGSCSSGDESPGLSEVVISTTLGEGHYPNKRTSDSWLLPSETIQTREHNIGYLSLMGKLQGSVTVTNYRLRFKSKDQTPTGKHIQECLFYVPLGMISRVDKIGHSNVSRGEDAYGLEIVCKDFLHIKFFSRQENHSRRPLFECLTKFAFPVTNKLPFFAYTYDEKFDFDGWRVYDPVKEFKRMGVPSDTWKCTDINQGYNFCDTYPKKLWIPKAVPDDEFLERVGSFRSKSRIPILSWIDGNTAASLTRCSQPMTGMTGRRSAEDEQYLKYIIEANAQSAKLCIMDARPEVNAKVNKAKGGGYESEEAYKDCSLLFFDIQNIHVMRESLRKLKDICSSRVDDKSWFSSLDDTNWLEHIKLILNGAAKITDKIHVHKTSVLVHCSDGWDRTAQLTSLSMLMLDPYYRTMVGYEVLIEKEWCSAGHKFAQRIGHGEEKHSDERSPVFLQFLDATWQLLKQFPTAFEFTSNFLMHIATELYSCRFGTFLQNSERQRHIQGVYEKTNSLWSMLNSSEYRQSMLNPLYNQAATSTVILTPTSSLRRISLWKEYYLQHNHPVHSKAQVEEILQVQCEGLHVREILQDKIAKLKAEQMRQTQQMSRQLPTSPVVS